MPTYQYACTECGEGLEAVQRFSDAPLSTCPRCSGRLRKVFSPVGVVFKGSGFYRTDSRSVPTADKPGDRVDARAGGAEKAATPTDNGKAADNGKPAPASSGAAGSGSAAKRSSSPVGTVGSTS